MRRTFLLTVALTAVIATAVNAQTAIRCEVNGKVVYGDAACAPGASAKVVAPIQETAEQKATGKAANDQIRKDTAAIDKRLDDRYRRDTTNSTVGVAKLGSTKPRNRIIFDSTRKKGSAAKPKSKAAKSPKAKAKKDSKSYRSAPKR